MSTHYETLGVTPSAEPSEIKLAWARLIRIHTPDQDPDANRHVTEAKSVLLDPVARADYDAQLNYGEEINLLFEEAHDAMALEDYNEAATLYKEILSLHPRSLDARNHLALAYAYDERFEDAVAQCKRLIDMAPASALYAANLGHIYWRWADTDTGKLVLAEQCLRAATELESFNSEHYISLARLLVERGLYIEAELAIEDAIQADGKVDVDDIDALMELAHVYLLSGKRDKVVEIASRIKALLPESEEAKQFAAFRFIQVAVQLVRDFEAYEAATIFTNAAKTITRDLGEGTDFVASIEKVAVLRSELASLIEDKSIQPLVVSAFFTTLMLRQLDIDDDEAALERILQAARTWSCDELARGIDQCRAKYPHIAAHLEYAVRDFVSLGYPTLVAGPSASSRTGCATIVGVLGMALTLIVYFLA